MKKKIRYFLIYLFTIIVYLKLSSVVVDSFYSGVKLDESFNFDVLAESRADPPFIYRSGFIQVTSFISQNIPEKIWEIYYKYSWFNKEKFLEKYDVKYENINAFNLYYFFSVLMISFFGIIISRLTKYFYKGSDLACFAWGGITISLLPVFNLRFVMIYDVTQIFLFTYLFYLMVRKNFVVYYIMLLISFMLKETYIIAIPVFFVVNKDSMKLKYLFFHLIFQCILYLLMQVYLIKYLIFDPSQFEALGNHVIWQFPYNYRFFTTPSFVLAYVITLMTCILVITIYPWSERPKALNYSFVVCFVPIICLKLFFSVFTEIRDLFELSGFFSLFLYSFIAKVYNVSRQGDYAVQSMGEM